MWLKERHAFKSSYCTWPNSYTLRKIIVNKEDVSGLWEVGGTDIFGSFGLSIFIIKLIKENAF